MSLLVRVFEMPVFYRNKLENTMRIGVALKNNLLDLARPISWTGVFVVVIFRVRFVLFFGFVLAVSVFPSVQLQRYFWNCDGFKRHRDWRVFFTREQRHRKTIRADLFDFETSAARIARPLNFLS